MNRNLKIIITFIFGLSIFFIILRGLNIPNQYSPNNISTKIDLNVSLKGLFDENEYTIKELVETKNFILINIWSSWCLPCREEHYYLMKLKDQNVEIFGINYKDKSNNAKSFIKKMGNPYSNILVDTDGTRSIELGAIGVPETYLIDVSKSKVIKKFIGPLDQNKLEEIVNIFKL